MLKLGPPPGGRAHPAREACRNSTVVVVMSRRCTAAEIHDKKNQADREAAKHTQPRTPTNKAKAPRRSPRRLQQAAIGDGSRRSRTPGYFPEELQAVRGGENHESTPRQTATTAVPQVKLADVPATKICDVPATKICEKPARSATTPTKKKILASGRAPPAAKSE